MANYIDRDRFFLQNMQESRVFDTKWQEGFWDGVDDTLEDLMQMPSVDAVPVVRCKDCKHKDKNDRHWCNLWMAGVDFNGFCYHGERIDK